MPVVREAHAVGPEHEHPGLARQRGNRVLLRASRVTGFGVARRKQHGGLAAACGQRLERVDHAGFRNRQHREVEIGGQVGHRLDAADALDLAAAAADQVQMPRVAETKQVAEDEAAEAARVGRGADDGDRAWAQQRVEGSGVGGGLAGIDHGAILACQNGACNMPSQRMKMPSGTSQNQLPYLVQVYK